MATFEQVGICFQFVNNVFGLVRNMRDNATGYKSQITAGANAVSVGNVMKADAAEYNRRIDWMTQAFARNQTLMTNALNALGITLAEANSLKTTLKSVADHTIAATLTTGAQVNTESDYILANTPSFERLW